MTTGQTKTKRLVVPSKPKLKKDPGIPRLPDLKNRNAEKLRKHAQAELKASSSKATDGDFIMAADPTLATLAASSRTQSSTDPVKKTKEQVRRHYIRTLHKVIEESDIVMLVLDARDPEGCRSRLVEEEVRRHDKTLVFVLNKVDLIPKDNAQAWLKHLRHSTPTLPFRAASSSANQTKFTSTAPALMKLLKAYKPATGSVTVGVVGFPNVGKSSIINALKRAKVCSVAAQPGHTKDLQSIQVERGLRVVDSPGVVFDEDDLQQKGDNVRGNILLRNVVKVEDIEDPIAVVEQILLRTPIETIQQLYGLPEFASPPEFLTMLALKSGRLLKGGTPDLLAAGRHVLNDWNHQKIPYFSVPPSIHPSLIPSRMSNAEIAPGAEDVGQAQILSEFSKPFELPGLENLFGSADSRAFRDSGDAMDEDEEDVFYDAQEEFDSAAGMQIEETVAPGTRRQSLGKHARSPSPEPAADSGEMDTGAGTVGVPQMRELRQPKRQRKNKAAKLDATHLAANNPLNRGVLKKDRKRERKLARMMDRAATAAGDTVMDVDADNLEFTFMA
ncbi:P-loop containing nucleoside triphosphate hydrolase protein [Cylindrobasidium torrendii FP15055 ss-10]|uniref:p-loop containing nucleoside triphosphate hydrolase protein n=1 Tax=Cylindrobasidium torrendii FP15055 ss-10 TaxID=1314674 RepID=A0A0D7AW52_9AGAR|nr:P-loop containing nucleoside triphosphate hydrolase protein [Cylindrobasidium torrendii FP15055 ss-10]